MDVQTMTPDALDASIAEDHSALLIGASYIGKTHLLRESEDVDRVTSLSAVLDATGAVALDDLYTAWRAASAETRRKFKLALPERPAVSVAIRPRELDWLLDHEATFDESLLEAFDQAYCLRYDPGNDADRADAIDRCVEIGQTATADDVDRSAVEKNADEVLSHSGYEYESDSLKKHLNTDRYGATLLPSLVVYISDQLADEKRLLAGSSVRATIADVGREVLENASIATLLDSAESALSSAVDSIGQADLSLDEAAGAVASSGATTSTLSAMIGPGGAATAGALALILYLHEDPDETDPSATFGALFDDGLSPPAQAELETALDLPPRTIEQFRRFVRGDAIHRLVEDRDDPENEHLAEQLNEVEATIQTHASDVEALRKTIKRLERHAIAAGKTDRFVSEAISEAAESLVGLDRKIHREEQKLLQVDEVTTQPPYYGESDTDISEAIAGEDTAGNLVVVSGPHGTGKTTGIYRACQSLSAAGYDVRLPHLESSSPEFVKAALTATDDPTVAVVSYKRGMAARNSIDGTDDLRPVLRWLADDICEAVILECREELYNAFERSARDIEDDALNQLFDAQRSVEVTRFDRDDERIADIVRWVLSELDFDGDSAPVIDEVLDIADGNPEIAKIAARYDIASEDGLEDVTTPDELIWKDIKDFFGDTVSDLTSKTFEYTCAFQSITTEQLLALLSGGSSSVVNHDTLTDAALELAGYLNTEEWDDSLESGTDRETADQSTGYTPEYLQSEDGSAEGSDSAPEGLSVTGGETWSITPDIYGEVVFRKWTLGNAGPDRPGAYDARDRFETYLSGVDAVESPYPLFEGLAENLSIAFQSTRARPDGDLTTTIELKSYQLLTAVSNADLSANGYVMILRELVTDGIPADPNFLADEADRIATGSVLDASLVQETTNVEGDAADRSFVFASILISRLITLVPDLWLNQMRAGRTEPFADVADAIVDVGATILDELEQSDVQLSEELFDDEWYLAVQMAGATMQRLMSNDYDPADPDVSALLRFFEDLVAEAALNRNGDDQMGTILYFFHQSSALHIMNHPSPEAADMASWFDELGRMIVAVGKDPRIEASATEVTRSVHGYIVENLATNWSVDRSGEWLDTLERIAVDVPDEAGYETPSAYAESMHRTILRTHADAPQSDVADWLAALEARLLAATGDDQHSTGTVVTIYASLLRQAVMIAVRSDRDRAIEWVRSFDDRAVERLRRASGSDPRACRELLYAATIAETLLFVSAESVDPAVVRESVDVLGAGLESVWTDAGEDDQPDTHTEHTGDERTAEDSATLVDTALSVYVRAVRELALRWEENSMDDNHLTEMFEILASVVGNAAQRITGATVVSMLTRFWALGTNQVENRDWRSLFAGAVVRSVDSSQWREFAEEVLLNSAEAEDSSETFLTLTEYAATAAGLWAMPTDSSATPEAAGGTETVATTSGLAFGDSRDYNKATATVLSYLTVAADVGYRDRTFGPETGLAVVDVLASVCGTVPWMYRYIETELSDRLLARVRAGVLLADYRRTEGGVDTLGDQSLAPIRHLLADVVDAESDRTKQELKRFIRDFEQISDQIELPSIDAALLLSEAAISAATTVSETETDEIELEAAALLVAGAVHLAWRGTRDASNAAETIADSVLKRIHKRTEGGPTDDFIEAVAQSLDRHYDSLQAKGNWMIATQDK